MIDWEMFDRAMFDRAMMGWADEEREPKSEADWLKDRVYEVDALTDFLMRLMPAVVGAEYWDRWLNAAKPNEAPRKVRSARTSNRQALIENQRTIRKLQREQERYEEKARDTAEKLAQAQTVEAMILSRMVALKLLALAGPRLSMGPAWTVLRAIAFPKHRLPGMMREHGEAKFDVIAEFLDSARDSDSSAASIWRTLFFSAGNPEFESRLHVALAEVCRDFDLGPSWASMSEADETAVEARIQIDDRERLEFLQRLGFDGPDPRPLRKRSATPSPAR